MDSREQECKWNKACVRAKHILHKQKVKTGVAILGNSLPERDKDPKFQGEIRRREEGVAENRRRISVHHGHLLSLNNHPSFSAVPNSPSVE